METTIQISASSTGRGWRHERSECEPDRAKRVIKAPGDGRRAPATSTITRLFLPILILWALLAVPLSAQTRQDPIKCWWKTDKSAVQVGEHFALTLTCGVLEARGSTVVPKMEQLEPGAVQLAPFEIVSGTRHDDIQSAPWRYFQYDYTLRLINQDFFGEDVDVPSLTVTYNLKLDVADESAGRDRMYMLPPLPMRIMSLVPGKANDIRDVERESFAAANTRLSRARRELIIAAVFFGFSGLMIAFAVVGFIRRRREKAPVKVSVVSNATIMRACLEEIGRIQSEVTRAGWTTERAGSALTVLRIGSAVAIQRPVAQAEMNGSLDTREGQLAVRKGILNRERVAVSAAITPGMIDRSGVNGAEISALGKSLAAFSAVRYGRNGVMDGAVLNRALESSRGVLQRVRMSTLLPMRLRSFVWTR